MVRGGTGLQDNHTSEYEKRILVLSNACFSDSDSNGRTLQQLFRGYKRENLAQFFVYGTPDFDACSHYYQVTDRDALNSFLHRREYGNSVSLYVSNTRSNTITSPENNRQEQAKKKIRKSPSAMLLRELAWKFGKWNGERLSIWIDEFRPDALFVSLADNIFLIRLAMQIVRKYKFPLYVYSTESYCFKKYNYLTKRSSLFYKIFHNRLMEAYRKIEPYVALGIFNTPLLSETYEQQFKYPCKCVFSPSNIDFIDNSDISGKVKVSYLGNLGVGRHVALVELADVLGQLYPGTKLDIYGRLPENEEAREMLLGCVSIAYKGFVSYQEVVRIIHESTLLVHCELDDAFYSKDLKYAFSTKIADSVCSGTPFLIYARRDLAETDFLIRNECAFVASDREELSLVLNKALRDGAERKRIVKNAQNTREKYFSGAEGIKELIET